MNKRIFISIEIPNNIKEKLLGYQEEISKSFLDFNDFCPVKWGRKGDLHITLLFIGYVELDNLQSLFDTVEEITEKNGPFNIDLKSVSYGPTSGTPKMVWVNGERNAKLDKLQDELELTLLETRDKRGFTPHITLGRLIQWQFNKIEVEERPDVYKDISLSVPVTSIEIMESDLKKKDRYAVLRSFPLR